MPYGHLPVKTGNGPVVKYVRNQALPGSYGNRAVLTDRDAAGALAAVLKGKQSGDGFQNRVELLFRRHGNAENAAFLMKLDFL